MTEKELIKDLESKLSEIDYFKTVLFNNDERVFNRRSFGDLFKYYRQYKVTEKLLLNTLYKIGLRGLICETINKIVFHRYNNVGHKEELLHYNGGIGYRSLADKNVCDKYTPSYLNNLLKKE